MHAMTRTDRSDAEINADMVDVHILDITAHIEALLRGVREIQRDILTTRGRVLQAQSRSDRLTAAASVSRRLNGMLTNCDALKGAIGEAVERALGLPVLAEDD
jgi:hypothetical protein